MSQKAQIFRKNKMMPNVLTLQFQLSRPFPAKVIYVAPKWQIWKCELGWFLLGQSHLLLFKRESSRIHKILSRNP